MSSANYRAKSHFQVRTSERNPIFRCHPLRCPPLGPPDSYGPEFQVELCWFSRGNLPEFGKWVRRRTGGIWPGEIWPVPLNFHDFSLLQCIMRMYTKTCLAQKWGYDANGKKKNWFSGYMDPPWPWWNIFWGLSWAISWAISWALPWALPWAFSCTLIFVSGHFRGASDHFSWL